MRTSVLKSLVCGRLLPSVLLAAGAAAIPAVLHAAPYELPNPDTAPAQAMLQRFQAEYPAIEADANFFTPVTGAAWPCAVSEKDQYIAGGLRMALPEEIAKVERLSRKTLRDMGMDPANATKISYSGIVITPVKANCKDGKLDGEVEAISQYVSLMESKHSLPMGDKVVNSVSKFTTRATQRIVTRFEAGEQKETTRLVSRTFSSHETLYDDAAMTKMMANSKQPEIKDPSLSFSYYPAGGKGMMAIFSITTEPKFSAGLLGVNTQLSRGVGSNFMDGFGTEVMKAEIYKGKELTTVSTTPHRDGKPHGEQIMLMQNYLKKNNIRMDQVPGMEQARIVSYKGQEMIETRNCYIEGERVMTATCPKD